MNWGRITYAVLAYGSLFTLGALLYTMGVLVVRRPPAWGSYLLAKIGMLLIVGTIEVIILPNPVPIPPSPRVGSYVLGVGLFGLGLLGVAKDILRRTARTMTQHEVEDLRDQP